jgi:hypothetical protein
MPIEPEHLQAKFLAAFVPQVAADRSDSLVL